jgi:hypothetical protein
VAFLGLGEGLGDGFGGALSACSVGLLCIADDARVAGWLFRSFGRGGHLCLLLVVYSYGTRFGAETERRR